MSAPRLTVELTAAAKADYTNILFSTEQIWGERQMTAYSTALVAAFATLASSPSIGRSRDELRPGLRSHRVKQHVIYYHVDDSRVTIVRLLHGRQEFEREHGEP